jgi:hypothetical protein
MSIFMTYSAGSFNYIVDRQGNPGWGPRIAGGVLDFLSPFRGHDRDSSAELSVGIRKRGWNTLANILESRLRKGSGT